MTSKKLICILILVLSAVILVWWGFSLSQAKPLGGLDFRALYEGAACLLHHRDPFNPAEVRAYYVSTGGARLYPTPIFRRL
jgi:hypothetical protein